MRATVTLSTPIQRTPRVLQLEGLFDVPMTRQQSQTWDVELPLEERAWNVGLIVGPSGAGKSTIARALFATFLREEASYHWHQDNAVVDSFPDDMGIKEVVALLSCVGFSSPPSWLRPFGKLSRGEQFRVAIARMLAENQPVVVCDEFTSTVDRTVAQISSAAIAKTIRNLHKRFIAVTCHEDVEAWLQPDWTYRPNAKQFAWRSLQRRPSVELTIHRASAAAWDVFRHHHYLNHRLHPKAACFLATWRDRPVAFSAWLNLHVKSRFGRGMREHRTVCLPDYQGIGLGNALSNFCAALYRGNGYRVTSTTSHPAMIAARSKSPSWRITKAPSYGRKSKNPSSTEAHAITRCTAGFEYVGPSATSEAVAALLPQGPRR